MSGPKADRLIECRRWEPANEVRLFATTACSGRRFAPPLMLSVDMTSDVKRGTACCFYITSPPVNSRFAVSATMRETSSPPRVSSNVGSERPSARENDAPGYRRIDDLDDGRPAIPPDLEATPSSLKSVVRSLEVIDLSSEETAQECPRSVSRHHG